MKKIVLILIEIMLSAFSVQASIIASGDNCGTNCYWSIEDGVLLVKGTGKNGSGSISDAEGRNAPWYNWGYSVTKIIIDEGITAIGKNAFFCFTLNGKVIIPDSVESIGDNAFTGIGTPTILCPASKATLCTEATTRSYLSVSSDGIKQNFVGEFQYYQKEDGVYISTDQNGIPLQNLEGNNIYYTSANDMISKENICQFDLDGCKAEVLKNNGICLDVMTDCKAFVDAAKNHKLLKIGSKTYQSLNDLIKGNYDRRRIYTLEEANFVAGEKNRVSIKYR